MNKLSRRDPTRTSVIVNVLIRYETKKWNKLKKAILKYPFPQIDTQVKSVVNASPEVELKMFEQWMKTQVKGLQPNEDVWQKYLEQTYEKGHARVYDDMKGIKKSVAGKKQFIELSLNKPESIRKVKMMVQSALSEVVGLNATTITQMRRNLVQGFIQGDNPNVIARSLVDRVDKVGIVRARTIARTEVIKVHAESQLDAMERFGGTEVGFMAEWATAGDDRVCPLCAPLEATIMTIKEARGMLPRHPNCRCAYLPIAPGLSPEKGQKRSQRDVQRAVDKSSRLGKPKTARGLAAQSNRKTWKGDSVKIGKRGDVDIFSRPDIQHSITEYKRLLDSQLMHKTFDIERKLNSEGLFFNPRKKAWEKASGPFDPLTPAELKKRKLATVPQKIPKSQVVKSSPLKVDSVEARNKWKNSLSIDEKKGIEFWSESVYTVGDVRSVQLGNPAELTNRTQEAKNFIKAMKNSPRYRGIVYRGQSVDDLNSIKKGQKFSFGHSVSSSKSLDVGEEFAEMAADVSDSAVLMEIKLKGKSATDISDLVLDEYQDQEEVFIDRLAKFRVKEKTKVENVTKILLEEI